MASRFSLDVNILREVLDRLNLGVYITDTERHILLWNKKAEEITGHKAQDVAGTACYDGVLNHIDKDGHLLCFTDLCPLNRAITLGRQSDAPILVYAQKADGKRVPVSVSVAPLYDADGDVVGGIETFRDESGTLADLEFAGKIQRSILPKRFPAVGTLRFDAVYYPHDLVGGDFYDVRQLSADRFSFLVADVRGHGVSGALYTMWLRSLEDAFKAHLDSPRRFLATLNAELARLLVSESFATAVCGTVDAKSFDVAYSNAGHPPMLHYHAATSKVSALENHGLPLGISADEEYESGVVTLAPGDTLVAYTDGITDIEIAPSAGQKSSALGEEGLIRILRAQIAQGRAELLERVYLAALEECRQVAPVDDVLLFSISREP
jgi:phosphoserine phosphatase RsbU/P